MVRDLSILGPIAFLGPDLTAVEWADKLNVTLDEILEAFDRLGTLPKPEPELHPTTIKKEDQARKILAALRVGNHRVQDIANVVGLDVTTLRYKLNMMEKMGLVQRTGKGIYSRWMGTT
jgi:predicted Rossmann fold nucleotide-binding protein DprA/Smf involved in DNA uptake